MGWVFFFLSFLFFVVFFFSPLNPSATSCELTSWCLVHRLGCWTGPGHPRLCCVGCSGPAAAACAAAGVPPEGCSSAHAQSAPDMPSTGPATAATDIIWVSTPDSFQHFSFKKAFDATGRYTFVWLQYVLREQHEADGLRCSFLWVSFKKKLTGENINIKLI